MTHLVSIAPYLTKEERHCYAYHQFIEEAAHLNQWKFSALMPTHYSFTKPSENWHGELACSSKLKGPKWYRQIHTKWLYCRSLRSFLYRQLANDQELILFSEFFTCRHLHLLAKTLTHLPCKSLSVWLLYREYPKRLGKRAHTFRRWSRIIKFLLPPSRLQLLTDCEPIKKDLASFFCQDFLVLPVMPAFSELRRATSAFLHCWCPGILNERKGKAIIEQLAANREKEAMHTVLIVPASLQLRRQECTAYLMQVPEILSCLDYRRTLQQTDIILQPYQQKEIISSGVFVEAVTAGKMPIVSKDTWMALELARFGLTQLAVDWDRPDILSLLHELFHNPTIWQRLERMKQSYREYHSGKQLASCFSELQKQTYTHK